MGRHRIPARDVRARVHWLGVTTVMAVLVGAMLVEGYLHHVHGVLDDSTIVHGTTVTVPVTVSNGGPIIDGRHGTVETAGVPERTIALTFDDGPDPTWTPQVLEVLKRHGAKATFFVVGTAAIDHPDLLRQIVAQGHDIGVHSMTHPDLGGLPGWQADLELRAAQAAVIDAVGRRTPLFRPPYSSENSAVDDVQWRGITAAGRQGYLTVLSTTDGKDWSTVDAPTIARLATPTAPAGAVALLHDGGGDRSRTVAALDQLIPALERQGYRFTTVSDALGEVGGMQPVSSRDQLWAGVLVNTFRASAGALSAVRLLLTLVGVLSVVRILLLVVSARRHDAQRRGVVRADVTEPVSIIVPAYNESAGIEAAVRSFVASDHPVEVIVVDDGSTDGTADLVESLHLPGVRVVRQENAGKPAALTTGLRLSTHNLVVMVDGDTVFETTTVRRLVQPFVDPEVGAISGNAKVVNREGLLGKWQHIEYVIGFNLDRRLFDLGRCMPTVPGAVGAFRRHAVLELGGVPGDTLAEDTDLTMAMNRAGWRVIYEQRARAWTEAPASLGALWRQRYRWCYGTLQAMWKHRGAVLQDGPGGRFGRRGLTYLLLFQVMLPLLGPVVDVFAAYGLIFLDRTLFVALGVGILVVNLAVGAYAFRLDNERLRPLLTLPLQQFVYRQLMYLVVIQSVFTALAGTRLRWQRMERYGSLRVPARV